MERREARKFKMGEVHFKDLIPGDIVEGTTSDGRKVTFEALEREFADSELVDVSTEKDARAGVAEFGVNLSGKNVPVYTASTGTTSAGTLYPNECFVFTGSTSGSRYQIEFLNSKGAWVKGWYVGTNGMSYWKNRYHYYGYIKVDGTPQFRARVYEVTKTTGVYHGNKQPMGKGTIYSEDFVFVEADQCYPGSSERDWMRIRGFTYTSNPSHTGIYSSCDEYGSWYGYVDTQIKHGSTKPAIRGNW